MMSMMMMFKRPTNVLVLVALSLSLNATVAHSAEPTSTISVRGAAHIVLPADHAILSVTVTERAFKVEDAYTKAESRIKTLVEFLQQSKIEQSAIELAPISLARYSVESPQGKSSFNKGQRNLPQTNSARNQGNEENQDADEPTKDVAYMARRQLKVTLHKLDQLDVIHLGIIQRGIERLDGIEYQNSTAKDAYVRLREEAVREAREKAESMAKQLGNKPVSIRSMVDVSAPLPSTGGALSADSDPFSSGGMGGYGMGGSMGSGRDVSSRTMQIPMTASVDVVFWLEDKELK